MQHNLNFQKHQMLAELWNLQMQGTTGRADGIVKNISVLAYLVLNISVTFSIH